MNKQSTHVNDLATVGAGNGFLSAITNLGRTLGTRGLTCAWVAALLAGLYVLSCAPVMAVALRTGNQATIGAMARLYSPIGWLHEHTILRKPLEAYGKMWGFN